MSTGNRIRFSAVLFCIANTTTMACHQDHIANSSTSVTNGQSIFTTTEEGTEVGPDTEMIPTTSAGELSEGDVNPTKFCEVHPSDDYPGFVFVCSGEASGGLRFDYYGDVPINGKMTCTDMREEPYNEEKPEGYAYTCFMPKGYEFGPNVPSPNGRQIEACCLRDSPVEAAADYCRVDAAEELCFGASEALNELRATLPAWPELLELNHQLDNLNKFIADSETQTACSLEFAKGFVQTEGSPVFWKVEHSQALDPEVGWPFFRDISTYVTKLEIEEVENNGLSCSEIGADGVTGDIGEGTLLLESHLGNAKADVAGTASYKRADCRLASCEFHVERFSLEVDDFEVDTLTFTDVSVALAAPTAGLIHGDMIALPENRVYMTATFRVAELGRPLFEGAPVTVSLHNHGVAQLRLLPDSTIAVQELEVMRWPFKMKLGL